MKQSMDITTSAVVTDPYRFTIPCRMNSEALSGETTLTLTATAIYLDVQDALSGLAFIRYGDIYEVEARVLPNNIVEEVVLYLYDGTGRFDDCLY